MAYNVTITYTAPVAPADVTLALFSIWTPSSYVDSQGYNSSVYDTNKPGFGTIAVPEPYATTSFPSASPLFQFKVATAVASGINAFSTDSFSEAMWYAQAGKDLASQGFTVTVAKAA